MLCRARKILDEARKREHRRRQAEAQRSAEKLREKQSSADIPETPRCSGEGEYIFTIFIRVFTRVFFTESVMEVHPYFTYAQSVSKGHAKRRL